MAEPNDSLDDVQETQKPVAVDAEPRLTPLAILSLLFGVGAAILGLVSWFQLQVTSLKLHQARGVAEIAIKRADLVSYNLQVRQVQDVWQDDPAYAVSLLADQTKCKPELRDFTWSYFYHQASRDRSTLQDGQSDTLVGQQIHVWSVAFSPDGKTLAAGNGDGLSKYDFRVTLWDVETSTERAVLRGHHETVRSVAFSPDGKTLATGGQGIIKLWDVATGIERTTLEGHRGSVRSLAYSPDGWTIASCADNTIKLWDVATNSERAPLTGELYGASSVAFSPDGQTLASGGVKLKLWDVETGSPAGSDDWDAPNKRATLSFEYSASSVAFSPDGKSLASDNKVWDLKTRAERGRLNGNHGVILAVAFSPDGKTLATGGHDNTVKLWDSETRTERATLMGHESSVWSLAFSPDGKILASGSGDGTIKLWRAATGHPYVTEKEPSAPKN